MLFQHQRAGKVKLLTQGADKLITAKGVCTMDTLALILVIIGALNWGLIGLFQFDLVASLFGGMSATFARIVYTLVGLAGVWGITLLFRRDGIRHHDEH